jgi:hypothetical protein
MVASALCHGSLVKIGYSLFAIRYSQKLKRQIDTGRRYAFGKVEQESERGTSMGNFRVVTLRLWKWACQEKSQKKWGGVPVLGRGHLLCALRPAWRYCAQACGSARNESFDSATQPAAAGPKDGKYGAPVHYVAEKESSPLRGWDRTYNRERALTRTPKSSSRLRRFRFVGASVGVPNVGKSKDPG